MLEYRVTNDEGTPHNEVEHKWKTVYRIVDQAEFKEIQEEVFLEPHGFGNEILFGFSIDQVENYSGEYVCEILLPKGTLYDQINDILMGSTIGSISKAIPTFLVRLSNIKNEESDIPTFHEIMQWSIKENVHFLDVYYYVKYQFQLPKSYNDLESFYKHKKELVKKKSIKVSIRLLNDTIFLKDVFGYLD